MSLPTQEPYNLSSATITGNSSAMTISWDHNTTNTVNYTFWYVIDIEVKWCWSYCSRCIRSS